MVFKKFLLFLLGSIFVLESIHKQLFNTIPPPVVQNFGSENQAKIAILVPTPSLIELLILDATLSI